MQILLARMAPDVPAAELPNIRDGHAEYAAAEALLSKLRENARQIEHELQEAELHLHEQVIQEVEGQVEAGALELIAGTNVTPAEPIQAKVVRLRASLASHRRAAAIQRAKVRDLKSEATAGAALQLMPDHRKAVGNVLAVLEALANAIEAEAAVRARLADAGYDQGLRDFQPPSCILNSADLLSNSWKRDATEYAR